MFLLMLHLVAITLLILAVASVAFRLGLQTGERRLQQRLDWAEEDRVAEDRAAKDRAAHGDARHDEG